MTRDTHADACEGLRSAVRNLERGNLDFAAVQVLTAVRCSATAAGAGELSTDDEAEIHRAAREILLTILDQAATAGPGAETRSLSDLPSI